MNLEIRRRALRAAAAVSLTLGVAGCAGEVEIASGSTTGTQAGTGGTAAQAGTGGTGGIGGAGTGGAGGAPVADAGPDAPVDCSMATDYVACCNAAMWSFDAGCEAWGPPMPPAMSEVA